MGLDTIKRTLLKPARYDGIEYDAGAKLTIDASLKRPWIEAGLIADEPDVTLPPETVADTLAAIEVRIEENQVDAELTREAAVADLAGAEYESDEPDPVAGKKK